MGAIWCSIGYTFSLNRDMVPSDSFGMHSVVLFKDENEVRKVFQHSFASVASGEAYDYIHRCDTNVRGAASVVLPLLR